MTTDLVPSPKRRVSLIASESKQGDLFQGAVADPSSASEQTTATVPDRQKRRDPSQNELLFFHELIGGMCPMPLCTNPLVIEDGGRNVVRHSDMAHIYPLNITPYQSRALEGVVPPDDLNDRGNFIPLCKHCHKSYDDNITLIKYNALRKLRDDLDYKYRVRHALAREGLPDEVCDVLHMIASSDEVSISDLSEVLLPATVKEKVGKHLPGIDVRRLERDVAEEYFNVRALLMDLERRNQGSAEVILAKMRTISARAMKVTDGRRSDALSAIRCWLVEKSGKSATACDVALAFFVQNCEVFSAPSF